MLQPLVQLLGTDGAILALNAVLTFVPAGLIIFAVISLTKRQRDKSIRGSRP